MNDSAAEARELLNGAQRASGKVRSATTHRQGIAYFVWAAYFVLGLVPGDFLSDSAAEVLALPTLLVGALILAWQAEYLRRGRIKARGAHDPTLSSVGWLALGIPTTKWALAGVGVIVAATVGHRAGFPLAYTAAATAFATGLVVRGNAVRQQAHDRERGAQPGLPGDPLSGKDQALRFLMIGGGIVGTFFGLNAIFFALVLYRVFAGVDAAWFPVVSGVIGALMVVGGIWVALTGTRQGRRNPRSAQGQDR